MELVIQLFQYSVTNMSTHMANIRKYRQWEINQCLLFNMANPIIHKIHVLLEHEDNLEYYKLLIDEHPNKNKVSFTVFGKQPTYAEIVKFIHTTIPDGTTVCIQNSDIYFGAVSPEFLKESVTSNIVVTLTRHEETDPQNPNIHMCGEKTCPLIYDYMGSHDTFIFQTPIPKDFPYERVNINQNLYGAESVFLKGWVDTGKTLFNPCFDIPIFHKHLNRVKFGHYETVAEGSLCHINPTAPKGRDDIQKKLKTIYPV